MTENEPQAENLSGISTHWSLVHDAHHGQPEEAHRAQTLLMQRYCGAVYRYLLAVLHDPHETDDLVQEFALRFVRGDFRRADPAKGRFRDYVKTAVYHLLCEHYRRRNALPGTLPGDSTTAPAMPLEAGILEAEFLNSWRQELLNRAWESLEQAERETGTPYFQVLRRCAGDITLSARTLAEELSQSTGRGFTEAGVRQILHRARERYADLLVDEVARSLAQPERGQVEQELADLNLLSYCRATLRRGE